MSTKSRAYSRATETAHKSSAKVNLPLSVALPDASINLFKNPRHTYKDCRLDLAQLGPMVSSDSA